MRTERDVRLWLRGAVPKGSLFWLEAGRGGTVGMPDAIVVEDGRTTFLELKIGELCPMGKVLRYRLRPEQRRTIARLASQGVATGLLVGIRGVGGLAAIRPSAASLGGRVDLREGVRGGTACLIRAKGGKMHGDKSTCDRRLAWATFGLELSLAIYKMG